uniref:uncharacterized protein LOC120886447 n=1 Tax=Ictidomys tridecemlineatus TaxID=43179 RepID=UPI001A9F1B56|nr:uncharacterized protein LOC120886447 [Ictidomys tridecemlineatus]
MGPGQIKRWASLAVHFLSCYLWEHTKSSGNARHGSTFQAHAASGAAHRAPVHQPGAGEGCPTLLRGVSGARRNVSLIRKLQRTRPEKLGEHGAPFQTGGTSGGYLGLSEGCGDTACPRRAQPCGWQAGVHRLVGFDLSLGATHHEHAAGHTPRTLPPSPPPAGQTDPSPAGAGPPAPWKAPAQENRVGVKDWGCAPLSWPEEAGSVSGPWSHGCQDNGPQVGWHPLAGSRVRIAAQACSALPPQAWKLFWGVRRCGPLGVPHGATVDAHPPACVAPASPCSFLILWFLDSTSEAAQTAVPTCSVSHASDLKCYFDL